MATNTAKNSAHNTVKSTVSNTENHTASNTAKTASIPMRSVGPIQINSDLFQGAYSVPLATFETPVWAAVRRGAKVSREVDGGIRVALFKQNMTRSVLFQAENAQKAVKLAHKIEADTDAMAQIISNSSRFAQLESTQTQVVGNLIYLRLSLTTGDAAGHNMVTHAADQVMAFLLKTYPALQYVSISANYCTDKKVSAVNGILGRGKYVIAELTIPADICQKLLKTTPAAMVDLHIKKNLLGSHLAGSVRSANAHVANILLACYLATGQDAANIIEGSQSLVHAEAKAENLYFSVTLPNIIVGTVGSGKTLDFVQDNLQALDCVQERTPGENAARLAMIIAATVLCGELSLLAALTQPGELMRSHLALERRQAQQSPREEK